MEKFRIAVHEYDANFLALLFNQAPFYDKRFAKITGDSFRRDFLCNHNGHFRWGIDLPHWMELSRQTHKSYAQDHNLIYWLKDKTFEAGEKMIKLRDELSGKDLTRLSDSQLKKYFLQFFELDKDICVYGLSLVALDLPHDMLTNKLNKRLKATIKEKKLKKRMSDYFATLTQPWEKTFTSKERDDMIKLAGKVKKNRKLNVDKLLDKHCQKYCWLTYGLSGPPVSREFYEAELNDLLEDPGLAGKLEKTAQEAREIKKKNQQAKKELALDKEDRYYFDLAREVVFQKGYRKEIMVLSFYLTGLVLKEVARRKALPFKLLRFCTVEEIVKLLEKGKAPSVEELKERRHYLAVVTTRNKREILTGKRAREYVNKNVVKEKVSKGQQMNGQIASPGLIKGEVRVINQVKDLPEMVEGAVLVSVATNPDLMPAIKKSAAIVTEMGGMTCHAAIVSRELNKPCVIGVRNATKLLKQGDIVEVDAYHGIVRRLKE